MIILWSAKFQYFHLPNKLGGVAMELDVNVLHDAWSYSIVFYIMPSPYSFRSNDKWQNQVILWIEKPGAAADPSSAFWFIGGCCSYRITHFKSLLRICRGLQYWANVWRQGRGCRRGGICRRGRSFPAGRSLSAALKFARRVKAVDGADVYRQSGGCRRGGISRQGRSFPEGRSMSAGWKFASRVKAVAGA